MYLLTYEYVEDIVERRAPFRDQHLAHAREWKAHGNITMGGAIGDPPTGALFVFDVEDPANVEDFAAADPYVLNGLVTKQQVQYWNVVV